MTFLVAAKELEIEYDYESEPSDASEEPDTYDDFDDPDGVDEPNESDPYDDLEKSDESEYFDGSEIDEPENPALNDAAIAQARSRAVDQRSRLSPRAVLDDRILLGVSNCLGKFTFALSGEIDPDCVDALRSLIYRHGGSWIPLEGNKLVYFVIESSNRTEEEVESFEEVGLIVFDIYELVEFVRYAITAASYVSLSSEAKTNNPARSKCLSGLEFVSPETTGYDEGMDILSLLEIHGATLVPFYELSQVSYVVRTSVDYESIRFYIETLKPTVIENLGGLLELIQAMSGIWTAGLDSASSLVTESPRRSSCLSGLTFAMTGM